MFLLLVIVDIFTIIFDTHNFACAVSCLDSWIVLKNFCICVSTRKHLCLLNNLKQVEFQMRLLCLKHNVQHKFLVTIQKLRISYEFAKHFVKILPSIFAKAPCQYYVILFLGHLPHPSLFVRFRKTKWLKSQTPYPLFRVKWDQNDIKMRPKWDQNGPKFLCFW